MINKPLPFIVIIIGILILRPVKGGFFLNQGSTLCITLLLLVITSISIITLITRKILQEEQLRKQRRQSRRDHERGQKRLEEVKVSGDFDGFRDLGFKVRFRVSGIWDLGLKV